MEPTGVSAHPQDGEPTLERIGDRFPGTVRVVRLVTAVIMAGVMGAIFWLAIMQEGNAGRIFNHRWSQHDFPDGLGAALGAKEHARVGLVATIVVAIGVTIVFALIERFLPGRGWVKGISFGGLIYLAWGLLYAPLINSHQVLQGDDFAYLPDTVFATRSGWWTVVSAAGASIVAGIVIARVLQLVRGPEWWTAKDPSQQQIILAPAGTPSILVSEDVRRANLETETPAALLELPEERADDGDEASR